jgi:hypothetical protein
VAEVLVVLARPELEGQSYPVPDLAICEHLVLRYVPGFVAGFGGAALVLLAPRRHRVKFSILAALLGLTSMEAEYWIAHGFPADEVPFFAVAAAITLAVLLLGAIAGFALGVAGIVFFAYVNIRYGAPYLLDYVLPVLYAAIIVSARRELKWEGKGLLACGAVEALALIVVNIAALWRTTVLDKWGWLAGRPW